MNGKVVWGDVADQPPRIISLLRTIRAGSHIPAAEVERALQDIDSIIATWTESESLSELREALGVNGSRGGRKKQQTVDRENEIVLQVINAALSGVDVGNYRKAADAINVDEKVIERAWRQWSSLHVNALRVAAQSKAEWAPEYGAVIDRLPPVATTNPKRDNQ